MDWLFDARTKCWSVQTTMLVREYVTLIEEAHQTQGALTGQRDVLTTTTAKRIRARMVSDLALGAVLPPVVIGAVVSPALFATFPLADAREVGEILPPPEDRKLSIIDGMQRTAAILEALTLGDELISRSTRVEFWLASNVRSMIYRMLVLNTGQVPWTISRQLSVVFAQLLDEITQNVPNIDRIFSPDKPGRRVGPAQYSSDTLVELYIAFSLRKTSVDTKEAISDEFSRLDFVENLSATDFQDQFYTALSLLSMLDTAFTAYDSGASGRFTKGRNIFDAQPARVGFIVAVGSYVLGRPGADRPTLERTERLDNLRTAAESLRDRLAGMTHEQLGTFLKLDVLSETLDRRVGQVGRYERAVFAEAFKVLIDENFAVEDMEPCWRAN
jgi:hypothetical protein